MQIRNLFLILLALITGGIPIITLIDIEYISTLEHMSIGFALFAWLPVVVGIFILVLEKNSAKISEIYHTAIQSAENSISGTDSDIVPVEDIELEKNGKTLYVGETLSLTAHILPTNATEQSISYKSSDVAVATVSSTGTVTGISPGPVSIQLSAGDFVKSIDLTVEIKTSKSARDKISRTLLLCTHL